MNTGSPLNLYNGENITLPVSSFTAPDPVLASEFTNLYALDSLNGDLVQFGYYPATTTVSGATPVPGLTFGGSLAAYGGYEYVATGSGYLYQFNGLRYVNQFSAPGVTAVAAFYTDIGIDDNALAGGDTVMAGGYNSVMVFDQNNILIDNAPGDISLLTTFSSSFGQANAILQSNGYYYVSGSAGVQVFNSDFTSVQFLSIPGGAGAMTVSPDSGTLLVAMTNQGLVNSYAINTSNGTLALAEQVSTPGLTNVTSLAEFNGPSNSDAFAATGTGPSPNQMLVFTRAPGSTIWKLQQVLTQGFGGVDGLTSPSGLYYDPDTGNGELIVTSDGSSTVAPAVETYDVVATNTAYSYSIGYSNMSTLTVSLTGTGSMTENLKTPSAATVNLSTPNSADALLVQATGASQALNVSLGSSSNVVNIDTTGSSSTTVITTASGGGGNTYNVWGSGAGSTIGITDGGGTNSFRIASMQLGGSSSQVSVTGEASPAADTLYVDHNYNLKLPNGSFTALTSGANISYADIAGISTSGFVAANPGTIPGSISVGGSLSLSAVAPTGLASGVTVSYAWDLDGSGEFLDASTQSVSFTWSQLEAFGIDTIGTYYIGLKVTASNGAIDEIFTPIQVTYTNPTVTVNTSSPDYAGSPVTLTLSAAYQSIETVKQWEVNWGDGTDLYYTAGTGTTTVEHTYASAATYTVSVYVHDDDDAAHASANYSANLVVSNTQTPTPTATPSSSISGASSAVATQSYSLTLGASNGTASEWVVYWGDGSESTENGTPSSAITHTYAAQGSDTIRAVAYFPGLTEASALGVNVAAAPVIPPTLTVSGQGTTLAGAVYNLSLSDVELGNGVVTAWTVNWGDGETDTYEVAYEQSASFQAQHVYSTQEIGKTLPIVVTATDQYGTFITSNSNVPAGDTYDQTTTPSVTVLDQSPTYSASLIGGAASGSVVVGSDVGVQIEFNDPALDHPIASYTINWGDGTTQTVVNSSAPAVFTFAGVGGQTVDAYTATVTDADGNVLTLTSTPGPNGQIVADPNGGFDVEIYDASVPYGSNLDVLVTDAANDEFSGTVTSEGPDAAVSVQSATHTYTAISGASPYTITVTPVAASPSTATYAPVTLTVSTVASAVIIATPNLSGAPSATTVALSHSGAPTLTDSATLSGGNDETGMITFTLLSPTGVTVDTESVNVSGDGTYSTPTGYTLPTTGTVTGTYQWDVSYSGDSHNNPVADTLDPNEQVSVFAASPTLSGAPSATTVTLRDSGAPTLTDSATLSGGYNETGTLTFTLVSPTGATVDTESVHVSGDGTYATPTGYTLPTTGTVTGTYQWDVSYSGDTNNVAATDNLDAKEQVSVIKATTTLSGTPAATTVTLNNASAPTLTDSATLSGGYDETGTITFTLVSPTGVTVDTESVKVSGNGTYATPTGYTLPTTGTVTGTYQWDVSYGGDTNNVASTDNLDAKERVSVVAASPSLTLAASTTNVTLGATTVVPGSGAAFNASATLSSGYYETGSITFTLYGPNNTSIYTDVVPVSGNGTYTTSAGNKPGGFVPTLAGTYQWVATYGGDGNNHTAGTTQGSTPEVAVGAGGSVVGTTLYLVGGNSNDYALINPSGSSTSGSTGLSISATLNNVYLSQTYSQTFTAIVIDGFNGNDNFQLSSSLTLPTTVVEGNGNNYILLAGGNDNVIFGTGSNQVFGGNGNKTITDSDAAGTSGYISLGTGNETITLGAGNDQVVMGGGTNVVTAGNGNDAVTSGNGTNTISLGNGNDYIHTATGTDTITLGSGTEDVQLGDGNKTVTAGGGNNFVEAGTGTDSVVMGSGNDDVQLGGGNNTVTLGNGGDYVSAGSGNNTITVGSGSDNTQVGSGNNVIVEGSGNDYVSAGNGDNLIVGGTGQHDIQVGNGNNILIDGSVRLTQAGDTLSAVLDEFMAEGASAAGNIRSRLLITYNNSHINTMLAGSGLDWFFATDSSDTLNVKKTDLRN